MMVEPRQRKQINYSKGEALPSDLDSSDDDEDRESRSRDQRIKDKLRSLKHGGKSERRRGRRSQWDMDDDDYMEEERDVEYGTWAKNDLFRLEKAVMTYGWGRWEDIMCHAQLRRGWTNADVEDAVRLSLIYSLQRYAGDEDIKTFVWDLITPKEFGGSKITQGHTGLSAPVPRGRKGKKSKNTGRSSIPDGSSWAQEEKYDAESFLEK